MINLLFDYDGTLHNSIRIYAPAFLLAFDYLVSHGLAENKIWTEDEISQWLGFNSRDMWNTFMPDLPQFHKDECSRMIGEAMVGFVREGRAKLYPHAIEVIHKLRASGYSLILLSNCKHNYMQAQIEAFDLKNYFSAIYCSEDFGFIPKYDIFNTIKQKHAGEYIVIGDRFQDMEIAQKHGLKSIGCNYGYGKKSELLNATALASQIDDILLILHHMGTA